MKKPIRIDSEAENELTAACKWYEQQCAGLGNDLLLAIQETIAQIAEYPGSGALHPYVPEDLGARRVLVKRFPYAVVYLDVPDEIRILAFAHTRRKPGYWREPDDR
jgi:plasmid stabilization system protein ParE